jgi:adenylosuccinate lyase
MIAKNLERELPFMAIEPILLACTKKGADRQIIHELLRQHCMQVSTNIKNHGTENNLIECIVADPAIPLNEDELQQLLDVKQFVGRAPQQVNEFLDTIQPLLQLYQKQDEATEISC